MNARRLYQLFQESHEAIPPSFDQLSHFDRMTWTRLDDAVNEEQVEEIRIERLTMTVERLEEALGAYSRRYGLSDLFPNETNEDVLAAKTAMTIALAALEVSAKQSQGS
jgi:hypothetical protein